MRSQCFEMLSVDDAQYGGTGKENETKRAGSLIEHMKGLDALVSDIFKRLSVLTKTFGLLQKRYLDRH